MISLCIFNDHLLISWLLNVRVAHAYFESSEWFLLCFFSEFSRFNTMYTNHGIVFDNLRLIVVCDFTYHFKQLWRTCMTKCHFHFFKFKKCLKLICFLSHNLVHVLPQCFHFQTEFNVLYTCENTKTILIILNGLLNSCAINWLRGTYVL